MSATMARQEGRVQLEQSDMHLALNMAKMARGGFLHAAIEEMQYLIKKPRAEVREEKKWGVEFPVHEVVMAAIERHPAMLCQNHPDRCLPCQNGTTKNPQTCWTHKPTGAPAPDWCRQPTPEPTPPLPGTPPTPPGNTAGAQNSQILNLPAGSVYTHTFPACPELFTPDEYAQDSQHDTDSDPDLLTDEATSTG